MLAGDRPCHVDLSIRAANSMAPAPIRVVSEGKEDGTGRNLYNLILEVTFYHFCCLFINIYLLLFKKVFIGVQLIHNVVLVLGIQCIF